MRALALVVAATLAIAVLVRWGPELIGAPAPFESFAEIMGLVLVGVGITAIAWRGGGFAGERLGRLALYALAWCAVIAAAALIAMLVRGGG